MPVRNPRRHEVIVALGGLVEVGPGLFVVRRCVVETSGVPRHGPGGVPSDKGVSQPVYLGDPFEADEQRDVQPEARLVLQLWMSWVVILSARWGALISYRRCASHSWRYHLIGGADQGPEDPRLWNGCRDLCRSGERPNLAHVDRTERWADNDLLEARETVGRGDEVPVRQTVDDTCKIRVDG